MVLLVLCWLVRRAVWWIVWMCGFDSSITGKININCKGSSMQGPMEDNMGTNDDKRIRREVETKKRKERRRRAKLSVIEKDIDDLQKILNDPTVDSGKSGTYDYLASLLVKLKATLYPQPNYEQRRIDFAQFETANGVEVIVGTMRLSPQSEPIATVCCEILGALAGWYDKECIISQGKRSYHRRKMENLERVGAYQSIKSAFVSFPNNKYLCLSVLYALRSFGYLLRMKCIFHDWDLAKHVLEALRRFGADDVLFSTIACAVISLFCEAKNSSFYRRQQLGDYGACDLVYNALLSVETRGGNDDDVSWCIKAVAALAPPVVRHPDREDSRRILNQQKFVSLGVDKVLATIANNQSRSARIRTRASETLRRYFPMFRGTSAV
jgi:hypothetical protein